MRAVDPAAPHVCDACGCVSCFIASDATPYPQCAAVLALLAERDALREAVTLGADALTALLDGGAILSSSSAAITRDFVRRMRAALAQTAPEDVVRRAVAVMEGKDHG